LAPFQGQNQGKEESTHHRKLNTTKGKSKVFVNGAGQGKVKGWGRENLDKRGEKKKSNLTFPVRGENKEEQEDLSPLGVAGSGGE